MSIENRSSATRTPAGCYVGHRLVHEIHRRTLHPAGVRPRKKITSINIAPRWGADILRDVSSRASRLVTILNHPNPLHRYHSLLDHLIDDGKQ